MFSKSKQEKEEQAFAFIRDAGFPSPTRLQQKVMPVLLQGKDVVVETQYGEGRTASFLVPLMMESLTYSGQGPYGLVISAHPEGIQKTAAQLGRFSRVRPVRFLTLGFGSTIKKEVKQLQEDPQIIIGTARRIIDHLRRNTINIRHIKCIIVNFEMSEKVKGFDKDIQFILSKVARKSQMGVFSSKLKNIEPLLPQLKHPQIITSDDWDSNHRIQSVYEARDDMHKGELLLSLILAKGHTHTVIYCRTMTVLKSVEKVIARELSSYAIISVRTSGKKQAAVFERFKQGTLRFILTVRLDIISHIPGIKDMIFYTLPQDIGTYNETCSYITHSTGAKTTTFFTQRESAALELLQEKHTMKKEHLPANNDVMKGKLKAILQRVHDADPDELHAYKKLINKHIPITRRAYVGALLFKETLGGISSSVSVSGPQQTLFVNIGKNRRVYPKDLSRFFCKTLNINQNDIGAVRVLDNYSFVEVPESIAKEAVAKMDGIEFRGRNIVVNFAKKKD